MTAIGRKAQWLNAIDYEVADRVVSVDYTLALKRTAPEEPLAAEVKIEVRKPAELADEIEYWELEFRDIQYAQATRIPNSAKHAPKFIRFMLIQSAS